MLNRRQLCEYLGASWATLRNVLPVRATDMGANIVRYNRHQIDQWAASLPPRGANAEAQLSSHAQPEPEIDTTAAALDRARQRIMRRP